MTEAVNLYVGFDQREALGFHTFTSSVLKHATMPVRIMPIGHGLYGHLFKDGVQGDGSTAFTYTRFLIPWLMKFRDWAIFCDGSDMLMRDDIADLWNMRDHYKAVQVVQHNYKTIHPRKFVGTSMECENRDYPRKNWSSVMLINCGHYDWRDLQPEVVQRMSGEDLHGFEFVREKNLGILPEDWNWLVDEHGVNESAKLLHWTAGIPAFPHYAHTPMADEWARSALDVTHVTL